MQTIKIYDKSLTELTTLTSGDFVDLSYKRVFQKIGEASFTVRLNSSKASDTNLKMYNRIEIISDGVVRFVGIIIRKSIRLDTVDIRCQELTYVMKRRIMGASYVANGTTVEEVTDLITAMNADDDTGITVGDVSEAIGSVNATFNRANPFDIFQDIVRVSGNQFRLETDQSMTVKQTIGQDLSASVVFRYDIGVVSASNILQFNVDEDGDEIVTKSYGKSSAFTSEQEDTTLKGKYGLLEKYRDFRVANTNGVLDDFTSAEIKDKVFSPDLRLNPEIEDTFDIGDTVRIVLKNALVDIDDNFQVLEKRVQYDGVQKGITVKINDLPNELSEQLRGRERRLELLEKEL